MQQQCRRSSACMYQGISRSYLTSTTRSPWSASHSGIGLALHFLLWLATVGPWRAATPTLDGSRSTLVAQRRPPTWLTHLQSSSDPFSFCVLYRHFTFSLIDLHYVMRKYRERKITRFLIFGFAVPWPQKSNLKTFMSVCMLFFLNGTKACAKTSWPTYSTIFRNP